ncbi:hypothetical protein WR25_26623 [Diploscapter pachys]|uniref:Saposin B-type domain-containing protein n=1 Tax=Diploscapter pachys TaxID=2018661 RepID=A0A2A2LC40_9BILA|nr:hypothetical protein WR25_26623 [Diploscapter pachys]
MIAPEPETIYPPIEAETPIPPELQYELERDRLIKIEMERNANTKRGEDQSSSSDKNDRIGHKNVMPGENLMTTRRPLPQPQTAPIHVVVPEEEIDVPIEISRSKPQPNIENTVDDKRVTCAFCERMLENARNYAVTSKTDITTFANTACASLPKGRQSDQCYQLADKKIADLAKFVDQQVVEALWCAELNQC